MEDDTEETNYKNFIALNRAVKINWIFKNAEYFRAWALILMDVNWIEATKDPHYGTTLECIRGQSIRSMKTWVNAMNKDRPAELQYWTKRKLDTFFKLLEKEGMLKVEGLRHTTRITVVNYDKYQKKQEYPVHNAEMEIPSTPAPAVEVKDFDIPKGVMAYLNDLCDTDYDLNAPNKKLIEARLEKYTYQDFQTVINKKWEQWRGTSQETNMTPNTLFAEKHFDTYLKQNIITANTKEYDTQAIGAFANGKGW